MKRLSLTILAVGLSAATMFNGCKKDPVEPDKPDKPARDVVTAVIEPGQATRTHIEWETLVGSVSATPVVKWTNGDQIAVIADNLLPPFKEYSTYSFTKSDSNPDANGVYTFALDEGKAISSGANYTSVYPASMLYADSDNQEMKTFADESNNTYGYDWLATAKLSLPQTQKYVTNEDGEATFDTNSFPMIAWGASKQGLQFKHICGLLEVDVFSRSDVTIKTIKFEVPESEDFIDYPAGYLSCGASISDEALTVGSTTGHPRSWTEVPSYNSVSLDCGEGVSVGANSPGKFFIVLPPETYTDFTLTVTTTDGKTMTQTLTKNQVIGGKSPLVINRAMVTSTSISFTSDSEYKIGYMRDNGFMELESQSAYPGFTKDLILTNDDGATSVSDVVWSSTSTDEAGLNLEIEKSTLYCRGYNNSDDYTVGTVTASVNGRAFSANVHSTFQGLLFWKKGPGEEYDEFRVTADQIEKSSESNPVEIGLNVTAFSTERYNCEVRFYLIDTNNEGRCFYKGINPLPSTEEHDLTFNCDDPISYYVQGMTASGIAQQYIIDFGDEDRIISGKTVWFKLVDDTTVSFEKAKYFGFPGVITDPFDYYAPQFSNESHSSSDISWSSSDPTVVRFAETKTENGTQNEVFLCNGKAVGEDGSIEDNTDIAVFERTATVTATVGGSGKSATAVTQVSVYDRVLVSSDEMVANGSDWSNSAPVQLNVSNWIGDCKVSLRYYISDDHTIQETDYLGDISSDCWSVTSSDTDFMKVNATDNTIVTVKGYGSAGLTFSVGNAKCGFVKHTFNFTRIDNSLPSGPNIESLDYGNNSFSF